MSSRQLRLCEVPQGSILGSLHFRLLLVSTCSLKNMHFIYFFKNCVCAFNVEKKQQQKKQLFILLGIQYYLTIISLATRSVVFFFFFCFDFLPYHNSVLILFSYLNFSLQIYALNNKKYNSVPYLELLLKKIFSCGRIIILRSSADWYFFYFAL